MASWCHKYHVQIWGWCLMPNHIHLIFLPDTERGLASAIGEAHRHEFTVRPLGSDGFFEKLENALARILRPQKHGPKKKEYSCHD